VRRTFVSRLVGLLAAMPFVCLLHNSAYAGDVCASDAAIPAPPPRQPEFARTQDLVAAMAQQHAPTLIVGDSIAGLWRVNLPGEIFNFGVAGDRTQWILWRLDQVDFSKVKFENVIVIAGTNNTSLRYSACETAGGVVAIVKKLHERLPSSRVFVFSLLPRGPGLVKRDDHIQQTNAILQSNASANGFTFLNAYTKFRESCGHDDKCALYRPDATHPSAAGYSLFSQLVSPQLANGNAPP
jgi:lysophospholipase L1-like esterase